MHYSAPEQRTSSVYSYAVDIYAAGYVCFELFYLMKNLSERIRVFEGIRRDDVLPPDFSSSHEKLGITGFKTQKIASSIYTMIMKVN